LFSSVRPVFLEFGTEISKPESTGGDLKEGKAHSSGAR
jgi:hypothetical protein